MIVVSGSEFRTRQGEYLKKAREGQEVILAARGWGRFKLVPVEEREDGDTLSAKIERARRAREEGRCVRIKSEEELRMLLESL